MKKWTYDELVSHGYKIENARIDSVELSMADHACLCLEIGLHGDGWMCVYGGYCLGKGYVGAEDDFFQGSAKGLEAIMRIMDVVGVAWLTSMKDKIVRVATKGWGSQVRIIGNVIDDKWFDYGTFFDEEICDTNRGD